MRLRLALFAVGTVPLIAACAVLYATWPGPVPVQPLALFPAVVLAMIPVMLILPRHILRTTEALDRSRAEMTRLYEGAKADALRDGLTGLGNHRAFQEELDRQLEWYSATRSPSRCCSSTSTT